VFSYFGISKPSRTERGEGSWCTLSIDDECENENLEALFEIHNCFEAGSVRSWAGGRLISEHVPVPIRID
jgi:hypothetical protein